jgi:hypothetical protein
MDRKGENIMKKKIIGILKAILLVTTILTTTALANNPTSYISNTDVFFDIFVDTGNYSLGTRINIKNIGDQIAQDIEWTFNASGGTIVFGDGEHGRIPTSMNPNDEILVILMPIPRLFPEADGQSPIGVGIINMTVAVQGTVGSTLKYDKISSNAFLLGPFILMSRL